MLEPGMRDEERKGKKIRKVVVGGEDLKGPAEEGWSGLVLGLRARGNQQREEGVRSSEPL